MRFGFLAAFVGRFRFCGTWGSAIWKTGINASEQIEASVFKAEEDGTTTSLGMCQTAKRQTPVEFILVSELTEISFQ